VANTWVQLRGTERQVAETEDPAAFSDLIRGQRRALQQTATAVAEQGVTVPLEVTDYLAKHADG
jgi:hypothetical protein